MLRDINRCYHVGLRVSHRPILCTTRHRKTLKVALHAWINQVAGSRASSKSGPRIQNVPAINIHQTSSQETQSHGTGGNQLSSPSLVPNLASTNQQGIKVNLPTGTNHELFVLFGVDGARRTLELAQIDVSKHLDDGSFFRDLRQQYKELRGFWRYWLSIWQLQYCDFVKVPILHLRVSVCRSLKAISSTKSKRIEFYLARMTCQMTYSMSIHQGRQRKCHQFNHTSSSTPSFRIAAHLAFYLYSTTALNHRVVT